MSALTWLAVAGIERAEGVRTAFIALFLGGMLIFPLTVLAVRVFFGRSREAADNPLGAVVMECTIAMIAGLVAAWLFLPYSPDFVFPLAAVAVGAHYMVFRTAYGDALFWALGGLVMAVGMGSVFQVVSLPGGAILWVGSIEALFGLALTFRASRRGSRSGDG